MSAAEAGQATTDLPKASDPLQHVEGRGLTLAHWTLRWAGDCWTVGKWKVRTTRTRWREASWHGRLDQALKKLLDRLVADEFDSVCDLDAAVTLVRQTYAEIGRGWRNDGVVECD